MIRYLFYLLFFFSGSYLCAQNGFYAQFNILEERPCAFDVSTLVTQPPDWLIYQTTNDRWDGPLDSSRCISAQLSPNGNFIQIPVDEIDPTKPVFVRSTLPPADPSRIALSDWAYNINNNIWASGNLLQYGVNCPDGFCTGVLLALAYPNEAGDSTLVRTDVLTQDSSELNSGFYCFATENLPGLRFEEVVLKATLRPNASAVNINLSYLSLAPYEGSAFSRVESLVFPPPAAGSSSVSAGMWEVAQTQDPFPFSDVWVFAHRGDTYPGASPIHYIEANTSPPSSTPLILDLFTDYSTLLFQPYTAVRGALVEGSDELRHQLNIHIDYVSCGLFVIDLMTDGGTHLIFSGGEIGFANHTSCFMFEGGGTLHLKAKGHLLYGRNGVGLLGLFNRGAILLEPHSTLLIDSELALLGQGPYQHGYVDLQPGSKLIFGKQSRLKRQVEESGMKLKVYMNGGSLDDSELSAEERALIERIYPHTPDVPAGQMRVFPNPAQDYIQFSSGDLPDGPADWLLYNALGKTIGQGQLLWSATAGRATLPPLGIPSGWYVLTVQGPDGPVAERFFYQSGR